MERLLMVAIDRRAKLKMLCPDPGSYTGKQSRTRSTEPLAVQAANASF